MLNTHLKVKIAECMVLLCFKGISLVSTVDTPLQIKLYTKQINLLQNLKGIKFSPAEIFMVLKQKKVEVMWLICRIVIIINNK